MKDQNLIDRFFERSLSYGELQSFQGRLKTDSDFREEVELHASLRKALLQKEIPETQQKQQIKNRLRELQKEEDSEKISEPKPEAKIRNIGRWLASVAAVAALFFIGYMGFQNAQGGSQELTADFYNNNYTPFEADITMKSIPGNSLVSDLDKAYTNKDYEGAITFANAALSSLPNDAEILMVKGISQMETQKFEEALSTFDSINNELYNDDMNWYSALIFIKQNKLEAAKTRLKKIKGKKYLKKIENLKLK